MQERVAQRPRVVGDREEEILEGVLDVLEDVGYDRLTFDLVAAEIRASKATLYRRWPTKPDLVIAAVLWLKSCPGQPTTAPDTGDLATDLRELVCSGAPEQQRVPGVMTAVLPALHRDPDLTQRFRTHFLDPQRDRLLTILERAQARGQLGADADLSLLAAIIPAMAIRHVFELGSPPDAVHLREVIDDVLLPACRATLDRPSRR